MAAASAFSSGARIVEAAVLGALDFFMFKEAIREC